MPQPFFCAVCDKPIRPSVNRKYQTVHDKCMLDYLDKFDIKDGCRYLMKESLDKSWDNITILTAQIK